MHFEHLDQMQSTLGKEYSMLAEKMKSARGEGYSTLAYTHIHQGIIIHELRTDPLCPCSWSLAFAFWIVFIVVSCIGSFVSS
jgi:hypothetical protein